MPSSVATVWGVIASGALCAVALRLLLRERRPPVVAVGAAAALLGPLLWNLILRHTGGDFFVDAPGYVFPVSFEDTGSGVFAVALAALLLGFGPLRVATAAALRSPLSRAVSQHSSSTRTCTERWPPGHTMPGVARAGVARTAEQAIRTNI